MIECPYCENEQDDPDESGGDGDEQEIECKHCEKHFLVRTAISVDFEPIKADCLNGSPHDYQLTKTYPPEFGQMKCLVCGQLQVENPGEYIARLGREAMEDKA